VWQQPPQGSAAISCRAPHDATSAALGPLWWVEACWAALPVSRHRILSQFSLSPDTTNLAVFGSVAKDQASADSDVDLLVDLLDGTSLFDRSELKSALEDLLLTRVDLIRRRNLKPAIKAIVEAEGSLSDGP
jgi:predicted nucleotidyltransferase